MRKRKRSRKVGERARVSKDEDAPTWPSCFETHRIALGLRKHLRSGSAAMPLSMRARGAAFWRNEPNARAKDQPAAARNERWRSFIVFGLLFTMRFATHTCRPD
jgi:hypothetical protein